jgi:hypothetical protein
MSQYSTVSLIQESGSVISTLKIGTCLVVHRMRLYLLKYKLQARIDYLGDDFPNQDLLPISMADKSHILDRILRELFIGVSKHASNIIPGRISAIVRCQSALLHLHHLLLE